MKMNKILAAMAATAISATSFAAMSISSASAADEIAKAYFIGSVGAASNWKEGENSGAAVTSIDGDAQYQVTWDFSEATNTGSGGDWFLAAVITPDDTSSNFTTDTYPNLTVTLDEVYVDGNLITGYDASNAVNTSYYEGGGSGVTRIYINSSWADGKTLLFDDKDIESQIKVVFTVSGLGVDGTSNVTKNEPSTTTTAADPTVTTTTAASGDDKTTTTAAKGGDKTTTTAAKGGDKTTTTAAKGGDKTTTTAAKSGSVASAGTGDLGVGAAVAAIAVAGVAAFVSRKKD